MTLTYSGQIKEAKQNTRLAWLSYEEGNKEEILAERIVCLMEKVTGWKVTDNYGDCFIIKVDDKKDFEELMSWYKEARRMFTNCMKYGF